MQEGYNFGFRKFGIVMKMMRMIHLLDDIDK